MTFTAPWAGPGNSEGGPVDPEATTSREPDPGDQSPQSLIATHPSPGPGNSDG